MKNLLDYLAAGDTLDQFLDDFPTVKREQAVAALELAFCRPVRVLLDESPTWAGRASRTANSFDWPRATSTSC